MPCSRDDKRSINQLRKEVLYCNEDFFSLIRQRQELIDRIQKLKPEADGLWNPQQEIKVFEHYLSHSSSDSIVQEDFFFSLLIELQARRVGNYPAWSHREHMVKGAQLDEKTQYLQMTNPILIYIRDQKKFFDLNLRDQYKKRVIDEHKIYSSHSN